MNTDGLKFDDFDLDLHSDSVQENNLGSARVASFVDVSNSSTSFCCSIATNITEDGCSWCNGCGFGK